MGTLLSFTSFVAGITFCCFLYLQNTIRFDSENVFSVLLSVKYKFKWFYILQFLLFIAFLESVPTFMEIGFV